MPMLLFWFLLPDALIKVSNTIHLPLKCTCMSLFQGLVDYGNLPQH